MFGVVAATAPTLVLTANPAHNTRGDFGLDERGRERPDQGHTHAVGLDQQVLDRLITTELLAQAMGCQNNFYILSRGRQQDTVETATRLVTRPEMRKVYPSFPMSHVVDMPDVLAEIDKFRADLAKVNQILFLLLDNAVKYSEAGARVQVTAAAVPGDLIEIAVSDEGIGIPSRDLERIFERFYRTDSARQRDSDHPGGSGLGLAIARSIVQAHGGQIWAESIAEKGLRIVISLPIKP